MVKVDLKDRKILYELDCNSRQSTSQIAKKVGLHKNVVLYRIKRLVDNGIIKNFYTVIDSFKLGYNCIRFYIVFRHITPELRKEIIDHFVNNQYTWWVGTFEGGYDLAVVVWVKELEDFYIFWEKTLKKYRQFFQNQILCIYVQLRQYRSSFLLENHDKKEREEFEIITGGKKIETDETDFKILQILSNNAREPTLNISKNLNLNVDTIKNRIKKLTELNIIQGFRANIDYTKLGYQFFKVNIDLNIYNERNHIINYIRENPHLIMIDKSIGYYDLELNFWLEDLNQFHQIMDNLIVKFPTSIKNYIYVHDVNMCKMLYLPEV